MHCDVQEIVKEQIVEPRPKVVGTRARTGADHVAMTPPQPDEANAPPEGPPTDGFSVRDPFLMVGNFVQCQYNDSGHQTTCPSVGVIDRSSCACKWWEAQRLEDNKHNGFKVKYLGASLTQGWEEVGVDLSRLRRTGIDDEFQNIGVMRNLNGEVDLAAIPSDMTNQEAPAVGEDGQDVEAPSFTEADTAKW